MSLRMKIPVHIELEVSESQQAEEQSVVEDLLMKMRNQCGVFLNGTLALGSEFAELSDRIQVCDLPQHQRVSFWQADIHIHSFYLFDGEEDDDHLRFGSEDAVVAVQNCLPSRQLKGLWESIVVDYEIKKKLLDFCSTSIIFAQGGVDRNIINWNKMILLHGPPGTGKTSLCRGLAQKIMIRHSHFFKEGFLFDVNCHSLFSKWFSESSKLVMKMFQHITEIAQDTFILVILLIDEVESIASARSGSVKSGEPSDAVRVVNAVLTSLDHLRQLPNVLVFCTSNMEPSLDEAFVDRLDLDIFLGNPTDQARLEILTNCVQELLSKGLITDDRDIEDSQESDQTNGCRSLGSLNIEKDADGTLQLLVHKTEGFSGRALRKLPMKTYASMHDLPMITLTEFLLAMVEIAGKEHKSSK